ncbi:Alpha/Beta hydrolase protein [Russula earlei]|uniref:Alpha/Beta hydrolase protein n=1 Tax=Russula earlei TaxID=71964 RepID=A0ACC0TXF3_9AGAM|nr:Alpha/Beta hydrolase protein [Russula earlei]
MTSHHHLASLIGQSLYNVNSFRLDCGVVLRDVPVAYKTWGSLNETADNVMVICHAFTGSADVEDWWGPLIGRGKAFDPNRFFIVCVNVIGSPYGTVSPVTTNPSTGRPYGPGFPATTIRDDVRLHRLVLDHLGVSSVAVAVGGSMGGMTVLEWPLCTPRGYVRHIIPIATSARHSAWCISWGEAQRQSIYSDPEYAEGYYTRQPASGLAAARMTALLTYRSRDSFESRFGRTPQGAAEPPPPPSGSSSTPAAPLFTAQSYLRYQGDKFVARFDANCYIHITRKLDTHDVARGRGPPGEVLAQLPPRSLVIGVETDGLFMLSEQREIAAGAPDAELIVIQSPDGHDGFLLEFEQINTHILRFLKKEFPEYYRDGSDDHAPVESFEIRKSSVFGEAEVDLTRW